MGLGIFGFRKRCDSAQGYRAQETGRLNSLTLYSMAKDQNLKEKLFRDIIHTVPKNIHILRIKEKLFIRLHLKSIYMVGMVGIFKIVKPEDLLNY